jgi:hypothetical protein
MHKPEIKLKNYELENVVVNAKTLDEFQDLMKVCEVAGFKWSSKTPALAGVDYWNSYKEDTCVNILTDYPLIYYASKYFYENNSDPLKKVISMEQFYKINKIDSTKLNEINKYLKPEVVNTN